MHHGTLRPIVGATATLAGDGTKSVTAPRGTLAVRVMAPAAFSLHYKAPAQVTDVTTGLAVPANFPQTFSASEGDVITPALAQTGGTATNVNVAFMTR